MADLAFLSNFKKNSTTIRYKKGEIILRPYDNDRNCYFVLDGLIKVYSIDPKGEEDVRVISGKDELFPVSWIAGHPTITVFFSALTDCTVVRIPQDTLISAMSKNPQMSFAILKMVANLFAIYAARIDNLEYKYARERLAYRLLMLAYRFGTQRPDEAGIELPVINQQVLGSAINVSRESVNRELNRFEQLGIIMYEGNQMLLKDAAALRKELGAPDEIFYFDSPKKF